MKSRKVLVVDDSLVARMLLQHIVSSAHPDWQVVEALDGEMGLGAAGRDAPDFIFLDVNMPGMGGLETARRMKEACPSSVICLVTANIQDHIRHEAEALGIGFMTKPVERERLLTFLDSGLDSGRAA